MKRLHIAPSKKFVTWNMKKTNGWKSYKSKTENNRELIKAAENQTNDPEVVFKSIEQELTKVKFSSFDKVRVYSKTKDERKLVKLQQKKNNIVSNELREDRDKEIELETINIKMATVLANI